MGPATYYSPYFMFYKKRKIIKDVNHGGKERRTNVQKKS